MVGDPKQAIYGWRGGDVGVFAELYQTPGYRHLPKAESYRYGPEIADAVNKIFAPGLLARLFPMRAAVTEWDKYFKSHAANAEHTRPGAVRVEDLEVAPDVSPVEAAARQIYRYLAQEPRLCPKRPNRGGLGAERPKRPCARRALVGTGA